MSSQSDPVGRRMSIRYRIGDSATDVIGRVLSADETAVLVERRDGELVAVDRDAVIASRFVPDQPKRRRSAAVTDAQTLMRISSRAWPAIESQPLGDWELRASGGFTMRANSVAAVGDSGFGPDETVHRIERFYRARSLQPLAQVVVGDTAHQLLTDHQWRPTSNQANNQASGALVQVADLPAEHLSHPEVTLTPELSDPWLQRYHRVGDGELAVARAVLTGPRRVRFASVGCDAFAIGRVAVTGEWASISAVEVHPDQRRRGWARKIIETCLAWAAAEGADKATLQIVPANTAGLALYESYGFSTHHEYRYLTAPPRGGE